MARHKQLNAQDEQDLWDALTGFRCYSYADIAHVSGWSQRKVVDALGIQRWAATQKRSWWTVPPLPKGRRRAADGSLEAYHFVVVDARTGEAVSEADRQSILRGGLQQLEGVEKQMLNFATTAELLVAQLGAGDPERERLSHLTDVLKGAGRMTTGATRQLADRLAGH